MRLLLGCSVFVVFSIVGANCQTNQEQQTITMGDTELTLGMTEELVIKKLGERFAVSKQEVPESLRAKVEQIAELFIREIEQGIEGTGIKAGVIKAAAVSAAVTPAEEKGFKAVARASKATGVPIETRTDARRRGGETQADILEAEGVSPARVSLGHSDDTDDVNYLIGLAKRGYTIGIDHVFYGAVKSAKGPPDYFRYLLQVPWQKRAGYVKQLIDAGNKIFSLQRLGTRTGTTVDNPKRFFGWS